MRATSASDDLLTLPGLSADAELIASAPSTG